MNLAEAILNNPARALADEGTVERLGAHLAYLAKQAGVDVADLRAALDRQAVAFPSCFAERQPALSLHYGPFGPEYRFRPTPDEHDSMRAAVRALYRVTDRMPEPEGIGAWLRGMRHLRARWAQGNYELPSEAELANFTV